MGLISLRTFGPQSKPADGVGKLVIWKAQRNAEQRAVSGTPLEPRKVVGATGFEPATPCAQDFLIAFSCVFLQSAIWSQLPRGARVQRAGVRALMHRSAVATLPRGYPRTTCTGNWERRSWLRRISPPDSSNR